MKNLHDEFGCGMYVAVHFDKLTCDEHSQVRHSRCKRFTSDDQSENGSNDVYSFRFQLRTKLARQLFDDSCVMPFAGRHSSDIAVYNFLNAFRFGQPEPSFVCQHIHSVCPIIGKRVAVYN